MLVFSIGQRTSWRRENFGPLKKSRKNDCDMRMSKIAHHVFLATKVRFINNKGSNEMIIQVGREQKREKERNIDWVRRSSTKNMFNFNVTKNLHSVFPSCHHRQKMNFSIQRRSWDYCICRWKLVMLWWMGGCW